MATPATSFRPLAGPTRRPGARWAAFVERRPTALAIGAAALIAIALLIATAVGVATFWRSRAGDDDGLTE
jgi:hypothetical protein